MAMNPQRPPLELMDTPPVPSIAWSDIDTDDLVAWATRLSSRLEGRSQGFHEDWNGLLKQAGLAEAIAADTSSGARLRLALFEHVCGPIPALPRLSGLSARWSMLCGDALIGRLCAFALLGRPGVLRCCVQRAAREALAELLGPAFGPLNRLTRHGRPFHEDITVLTPLAWACIGYVDLTRQAAWPTRSLRRLVRLGLPHDASIRYARRMRPTVQLDSEQGMQTIEAWFSPAPEPSSLTSPC